MGISAICHTLIQPYRSSKYATGSNYVKFFIYNAYKNKPLNQVAIFSILMILTKYVTVIER